MSSLQLLILHFTYRSRQLREHPSALPIRIRAKEGNFQVLSEVPMNFFASNIDNVQFLSSNLGDCSLSNTVKLTDRLIKSLEAPPRSLKQSKQMISGTIKTLASQSGLLNSAKPTQIADYLSILPPIGEATTLKDLQQKKKNG